MERRILHVVGDMNTGGIQTWLMHVLRRIDRRRYRMDFLIRTAVEGTSDDEIRALGSRVVSCPDRRRPWRFAWTLAKALRAYGPYDVVHGHVGPFNALVMQIAAYHRVPVRVAHAHVDNRAEEALHGWPRQVYLRISRWMLRRYSSVGVAASGQAAEYLFGPSWRQNGSNRLLFCGVDLTPFEHQPDRSAVRAELGLPTDALVIGHVGRFDPQKNHGFVIEIAVEVARRHGGARFLLVGEGELRQQIEARARERGLAERVVFSGARADVARLMKGAMDVFLLPSRSEGLGLVLIEAQAAGLPCVLSDVVPSEADVIPPLMHRLSLAASAAQWAETVLRVAHAPAEVDPEQALCRMKQSPFLLEHSLRELMAIYDRGDMRAAQAWPRAPAPRCLR